MNTAILVDGGFYRRRIYSTCGDTPPEETAKQLYIYCMKHLNYKNEHDELYRIFYYDCPPIKKKVFSPILQRQVDLEKSSQYNWMNTFLDYLKSKRKVALRLGSLSAEQAQYVLKYEALKKLCSKSISIDDLTENDFILNLPQKGVDMKIGLDIASMAFKKQVNRIILISGDSDFVPAAKLARREGIDFILDNMRYGIKKELHEHIDGIRTFFPKSPNC